MVLDFFLRTIDPALLILLAMCVLSRRRTAVSYANESMMVSVLLVKKSGYVFVSLVPSESDRFVMLLSLVTHKVELGSSSHMSLIGSVSGSVCS